jgi:hypothetical protein
MQSAKVLRNHLKGIGDGARSIFLGTFPKV